MPASTIFGNFAQAQQRAQQEGRAQQNQQFQLDERARLSQVRDLTQQAAQGGFGSEAFKSLVGVSPSDAGKLRELLQTDNQGLDAAFQDAAVFKNLLQNDPSGQSALQFGAQRLQAGQSGGRNMIHTQRFMEEIQQDPASALGSISSFVDIPAQLAKGKSRGPALSDVEKNARSLKAKEIQLSVAEKSGDKDAIAAATNDLKNFKTLSGKFGASTQSKADIAVDKANRIALSKQASDASGAAFKGLKNIRSTILNMGDAIRALDKGADTGPIISKLPSFREASIELDNIRGRMGLDVIGSVAFGALSESELAFALDTALPTDLQPKALKTWLKRKQVVQRKLAKGLRDAAVFLGKPGNTIADYIERQELKTKELSSKGDLSAADQEELRQLEAEFGEDQ